DEIAAELKNGERLALRDAEGVLLAALEVEEVWEPDRLAEAEAMLGTRGTAHPGVDHVVNRTHPHYVSGRLEGLQRPMHYDYRALRRRMSRAGRPRRCVTDYSAITTASLISSWAGITPGPAAIRAARPFTDPMTRRSSSRNTSRSLV